MPLPYYNPNPFDSIIQSDDNYKVSQLLNIPTKKKNKETLLQKYNKNKSAKKVNKKLERVTLTQQPDAIPIHNNGTVVSLDRRPNPLYKEKPYEYTLKNHIDDVYQGAKNFGKDYINLANTVNGKIAEGIGKAISLPLEFVEGIGKNVLAPIQFYAKNGKYTDYDKAKVNADFEDFNNKVNTGFSALSASRWLDVLAQQRENALRRIEGKSEKPIVYPWNDNAQGIFNRYIGNNGTADLANTVADLYLLGKGTKGLKNAGVNIKNTGITYGKPIYDYIADRHPIHFGNWYSRVPIEKGKYYRETRIKHGETNALIDALQSKVISSQKINDKNAGIVKTSNNRVLLLRKSFSFPFFSKESWFNTGYRPGRKSIAFVTNEQGLQSLKFVPVTKDGSIRPNGGRKTHNRFTPLYNGKPNIAPIEYFDAYYPAKYFGYKKVSLKELSDKIEKENKKKK